MVSLRGFSTLLFFTLLSTGVSAAPTATPFIKAEKARFTVITPELIRLEYSELQKFVDSPSLFAINRDAFFTEYKFNQTTTETFIDTGVIQLTYTPDGHPFSAHNLKAVIHESGRADIQWTPGLKNSRNLGGTRNNLDNLSGPQPVSDGVLARDGWFLLDDSQRYLIEKNWVAKRPDGVGSDWYFFGYGLRYKAALKSLTAIGGPVPMPRRYVLGSWFSRWWPYSSSDYRRIVGEFHSHDFPLDMVVMDMDWHKKNSWTGYSWNRTLFPDAENFLKWIHDQHLFVTLNDHPQAGVGTYEDRYSEFMKALGGDPTKKDVLTYDAGDQKYITTLFKFMHEPLERAGVDFWWLDWMGDSNHPFNRIDWVNEFYYKHSRQTGLRGQQFSRWADWGDHRHPIHFSGDTHITWPMLKFEIPFTAQSGNAGVFFWSHDMGGFQGRRNGELLARWVQFGAFSAALRLHSSNSPMLDKRPWTYGPAVEDSMRTAFHLRSEFFPYTYSRVAASASETVPLVRPLYLEYPEIEEAYQNPQEYLYGADILVAPITEAGRRALPSSLRTAHVLQKTASQQVWFPPGIWYDWFTGQAYNGRTSKTFSHNLKTFPLFVRGGIPLTLQPYTERMTTDPLKALVIRVYPGEEGVVGRAELYEDDGVTEGYRTGAYGITTLTYVRNGKNSELNVAPTQGSFDGQLSQRAYVLELPGLHPLAKISVDAMRVAYHYDVTAGVTRVSIPARDIRVSMKISILE